MNKSWTEHRDLSTFVWEVTWDDMVLESTSPHCRWCFYGKRYPAWRCLELINLYWNTRNGYLHKAGGRSLYQIKGIGFNFLKLILSFKDFCSSKSIDQQEICILLSHCMGHLCHQQLVQCWLSKTGEKVKGYVWAMNIFFFHTTKKKDYFV